MGMCLRERERERKPLILGCMTRACTHVHASWLIRIVLSEIELCTAVWLQPACWLKIEVCCARRWGRGWGVRPADNNACFKGQVTVSQLPMQGFLQNMCEIARCCDLLFLRKKKVLSEFNEWWGLWEKGQTLDSRAWGIDGHGRRLIRPLKSPYSHLYLCPMALKYTIKYSPNCGIFWHEGKKSEF